jgi:hypothetical protein
VKLTLLTALVGILLSVPATAAAADRYAAPDGDGAEPCAQIDPCDIETAVNEASSGDDITLLPGTYSTSTTLGATFGPFNPIFGVTIHGTPGARPMVSFSAQPSTFPGFLIASGSVLRDVIVTSSTTQSAAVQGSGGTIERVDARATGDFSSACALAQTATLRDSVCWHTGTAGPNSSALGVFGNFPGADDVITVRNVTAVSTTTWGLRAVSSSTTGAGIVVNATNVIAQGEKTTHADVRTERLTGGSETPMQTVNLGHSNFTSESEAVAGDITDPGSGTNVTTAPVFVNAGTGDFHQQATSTGTLNLGTATGQQAMARDIDGQARAMGSAPDIGADELAEVPPAPIITGTNPPSGSNENNPLVIGTAEPFSLVHVYATDDCTGTEVGAETAGEFASPGILVSVLDNSTTTFSANAVNDAGTSNCSAPFTYTEVTPPPTQPPLVTPQPPPVSPAPVVRNCKKGFVKKKVKGKKKCVKKKKRK